LLVQLLAICFSSDFGNWNSRVIDYFYQIRYKCRGPEPTCADIVFVDVDDTSFSKLGNVLMERHVYARLFQLFHETDCRLVLSDLFFAGQRTEEEDRELVNACRAFADCYLPIVARICDPRSGLPTGHALDAVSGERLWHPVVRDSGRIAAVAGAIGNFDALEKTAAGVGHITVYPDSDGVYRYYPLLFAHDHAFLPSIALCVACDLLKVNPDEIVIHAGKHVLLPNAKLPSRETTDITVPIDNMGRMVINYSGPWTDENTFAHYAVWRLLEAAESEDELDLLAEELDDAIVVLSDVSSRTQDSGPTPLETVYPKSGLHANVLNTILTRNFLRHMTPTEARLVNIIILVICVVLAVRIRAIAFAVLMAVLAVAFPAVCLAVFVFHNILVRPAEIFLFMALTTPGVLVCKYFYSEMEKARLRQNFEFYVAPPVLEKILSSPDMMNTVNRSTLTVMFADIVGFSPWSLHQTPDGIHSTLNQFFDEMTKIVFKYEGTIDKYIGDSLMVFFGDPIVQPDHALRAVKSAVEMQLRARELKRQWGPRGGLELMVRIGINTGEVAVGNLGTSRRMDYTVLGSEVNLAERLERQAPPEGILCSENTYTAVKDEIRMESRGTIPVKGFSEPVRVYEVDIAAARQKL